MFFVLSSCARSVWSLRPNSAWNHRVGMSSTCVFFRVSTLCSMSVTNLVTAFTATASRDASRELHSRSIRKRPSIRSERCHMHTNFWECQIHPLFSFMLCIYTLCLSVALLVTLGPLSYCRYATKTNGVIHGVIIPHWHRSRGTTTIQTGDTALQEPIRRRAESAPSPNPLRNVTPGQQLPYLLITAGTPAYSLPSIDTGR